MRVCVAVCTFRRPVALAALLVALDELRPTPATDLEFLVIDNAPEGGAAPVLAAAPTGVRDRSRLVHVGAGNIAAARNAVLDLAGDADMLALIDDDEVPEPQWLDELLATQFATGADIVIGPVRPGYPERASAWIRASGALELAEPADGSAVDEGITGNALLCLPRIRELRLRFDEWLGEAGGEDQLFFRTAVWRGASMVFASKAVVHEPIARARLRVRFLLRRELRKGNTLGLLDRGRVGWPPGHPGRRLAATGYRIGRGAGRILAGAVLLDRARLLRGALDVSRAIGMVGGLAGVRFDAYRARVAPRPVVAVVADEDPSAQQAGQGSYLGGLLRYLDGLGLRVVLLITSDRLGSTVSRPTNARPWQVRSRAAFTYRGITVARPRAAIRRLAWQSFRVAPVALQRPVDAVRTRWRHRSGIDHVVGRPLDPLDDAWVNAELDELAPAAVLYNTLFAIPTRPPCAPVSYVVCHDVVSDRASALTSLGYQIHPLGFDADDEATALGTVPRLIAIQWDDAERLRQLVPAAEVLTVPPGIAFVTSDGPASLEDRVLFVGSGSLHNVDGLKWFLADCWPAVRARRPGALLHVVGTVGARVADVPSGVVLRGEVDDLDADYRDASVVVVPLRAGSGLKVKLVEALCHGKAVVSTSVGAQGLGGRQPDAVVLADDADAFARAVAELLADPARRTSAEAAARRAATLFAPERAYAELVDSLRRAGVTLAADRPEERV